MSAAFIIHLLICNLTGSSDCFEIYKARCCDMKKYLKEKDRIRKRTWLMMGELLAPLIITGE